MIIFRFLLSINVVAENETDSELQTIYVFIWFDRLRNPVFTK